MPYNGPNELYKAGIFLQSRVGVGQQAAECLLTHPGNTTLTCLQEN